MFTVNELVARITSSQKVVHYYTRLSGREEHMEQRNCIELITGDPA